MASSEIRAKGNNYWLNSKMVMRNILILSAILTLSACTTSTISSSSHSSLTSKLAAAPTTRTVAAAEKTTVVSTAVATPAAETATVAAEAAPAAEAAVEAASEATVAEASAQTGSIQFTLDANAETMNNVGAHLAALVAEEMDNTQGMINQNSCIKGLQGTLVTSLAGQSLLAENGLEDETVAEGGVIAVASMVDLTDEISPAPSAGTAETVTQSATGSLNFKTGLTESLLMAAYGQTGRHFKAGGQAPNVGFDASGYTRWVYSQKGINVPRDLAKQAQGGVQVAKEDLRPGDLLVYRDPNGKNDSYHVGIYTGQGNFLHAAAKVGVVTETAAFGPQYAPYFVGGRRYYDDPKANPLSDAQKMSAASSAVKVALAELGPNDKPDRKVYKKSSKSSSKAKKKK